MQEQVDAVTGLAHKVIVDSKASDKRPKIIIRDKETGKAAVIPGTNRLAQYVCPVFQHYCSGWRRGVFG